MEDGKLAENILHALDIAVLKRLGPGEYEVIGEAPAFYNKIFPPTPAGPCRAPWRQSYMLEFFYDSVEKFFETGQAGCFSSGTWQEEGVCDQEQALIAEAMAFGDSRVITIRLLKEAYAEQVSILRKAREQLLERRLLKNDLEVYKRRSRIDGLTKVLNKTTFMELLVTHINYAREQRQPLSLIMMDIDGFKDINDIYGHQAGDEALSALGQILLGNLRHNDLVGRYGGDEFMVIIPGTGLDQARRIAEKLRRSVENHKFANLPLISISLGCCVYQTGEDLSEFIQRADFALYDAKRAGKNTVCTR
ncbi:MAG: GGDEF domain-containing protein [Deltaproteobacteria bacterium]|jgi:diguanylate cyclase (GGDEF)-like protein|nr:GGDEF domain-containing protein [Deltaproteobacteria bacterium]